MSEHSIYLSTIPCHLCIYHTMNPECLLILPKQTTANVEEKKQLRRTLCTFCVECKTVLECAAKQQLLPAVIEILKPVACPLCEERFADKPSCDQHVKFVHSKGMQSSREINPRVLTVSELKRELSKRGLVTSGSKDILCRRLEGHLASEL